MTLVIPALLAAAQLRAGGDSVQLCLRDATNDAPVVGARVQVGSGETHTVQGDCLVLPAVARNITVTRVGYRQQGVPSLARADHSRSITVLLTPLAVTRLTTQTVTATADADVAAPMRAGAMQATIAANAARERGVSAMNGVIALLPYTGLRSARGESGLSLRGARREQVVVTLDGLPLNDPATGLADVSDVPLAAVQAVTVAPGADPVNTGSGANGGVLALTSAAQRVLSLRTGAFGQVAAEAAYTATRGDTRWSSSVSHRRAANDFPFLNDGGVSPVREARVNNDETRTVLTLGAVGDRSQWLGLVSTGERGMVGAANVRTYDADRSRTTRVLVRAQSVVGSTMLVAGARHFSLQYRDPTRPVLDAEAQAWAADAEWRGAAPLGSWRVGAGADHLTGSGNVVQRRGRGFATWVWQSATSTTRRLTMDAGVRADAVERAGVQPTASAGATWRAAGTASGSQLSLLVRGAQAVRVPTLYDLYFSSPQRLTVRALDPERVTHDASVGTQAVWQRARWRALGEFMLVSRDTRNAIVWFPGNFGWSPANVGLERLRGTESRVNVNSAALSFSAWHTWYRSELRSGSLLIPTPYVPQHTVASTAAWRVGPHTLSSSVRYQGRRPFTAGPRNPLFELPAVTVADLAWSQRHAFAKVEALWSLSLENITDEQWQSVRGFPMPGRGWSASLTLSPRP